MTLNITEAGTLILDDERGRVAWEIAGDLGPQKLFEADAALRDAAALLDAAGVEGTLTLSMPNAMATLMR